jgi:hypothetical protein
MVIWHRCCLSTALQTKRSIKGFGLAMMVLQYGYAVLVCLLCRVSCLRKLKRMLINIKLLSATVWKQISNQYYGMYKSFFSVETRTDEFLLENSEKSSELPVGNSTGTTDQFTKFVIC